MVDKIVMEAPLTIPNILVISLRGTIPARKIKIALMVGGMASLIPRGLQIRNKTIRKNMINVYWVAKSDIQPPRRQEKNP